MAEVPPDFNSIIVCGEIIKLGNDDVKCVTFAHPEGITYSFPAKSKANEAAGKPRLQAERIQKGQRVNPMDKKRIFEVVHMVVIHTDLTSTAQACFTALVQRNLSTHFMIDWDGTIYQGMDLGWQAFHGGSTNSVSIGIDMNNKMPNLVGKPDAPPYPEGHPAYDTKKGSDWPFRRPKSRLKKFNGGRVKSYGYTDAQYRALIALLSTLTETNMFKRIKRTYPMDAKGEVIPSVVEGGDGFEGIVGHMHVSATRWDPGPGFDWQRVLAGMVAENNSFPMKLKGGDTLGGLMERAKVKKHAQKYYLLNESGANDWPTVQQPSGGWYPISPNQTWHGGIHLQAPEKTPILAMFEGKLVAARFNKCDTKLGSNNFICLRHEVEIPAATKSKKKKAKKKTLVFYSLYMHLDYVDVFSKEAKKRYKWVKKLHEYGKGDAGDSDGLEIDKAEGDPGLEKERKKKKRRRKRKKSKQEEQDEEQAAEQEALEEEEFAEGDEDCPQTKPKRHGPGLRFLREGSVATFEFEEEPIIVNASNELAPIGWFDPSGGESTDLRQVHVEVFADDSWKDAIDLAVHGEFFTEVQQADLASRSLFVRNKGLLAAFSPSGYVTTKNSLVKGRVLSRQEISDLFQVDEPGNISLRRRLRKIVVKSVSEWSDQVDWVKALSEAEDWKGKIKDYKTRIREAGLFKETLERVLPFIWLDGEIAEAIGLQGGGADWTGHLWHFHPIHFLMWLTFHSARRVQKLSRSVSRKKLKKMKKEEQELDDSIDEEAQQSTRSVDYGAALDEVEVEDVNINDMLDDFMSSDDVGEWKDTRANEEDY